MAFLYLIYLVVLYYTPSGLSDPDEDLHQTNLFIQDDFNIKST